MTKTEFQLGLGSIANYCNARGFKIKILDADKLRMSPEKVVAEVNETKTRFTGLNAVSENIRLALKISSGIRQPVWEVPIFICPQTIRKSAICLYRLPFGLDVFVVLH